MSFTFVSLLWRDWRGEKWNSLSRQRISIKSPTLLLLLCMKLWHGLYSVHHSLLEKANPSTALSTGNRDDQDAGEDDGGAEDTQRAKFFAEPEPTSEGGEDDADLAHGPGVVDL